MSEKYLPLSGVKSILRECLPEDEVFEMTELISAVTPADVAPVVHSKWTGAPGYWHCPECGAEPLEISPYCPGCGAKMDESEDNDNDIR